MSAESEFDSGSSAGPQFDFAVPDQLLRDVVQRSREPEKLAELSQIAGTGEGKPPPLIKILKQWHFAPLILLTAAAMVPGTFGNGIALLGPNLKASFHLQSNVALSTITFIAQVAQLLWGVPLALWADRGSRKVVCAVALFIFAVVAPLMGLAPNVWAFAFLYFAASVGFGVNQTAHNSYLSDAYPTEVRGRVFSWHYLADPLSQTLGILIFAHIAIWTHNWRYSMLEALVGIPIGIALMTLHEPEKGANESSRVLKSAGMDINTQQSQAPRVLLGSAITRILRIRSIYYELVAVAILGFAGTGGPLLGSLYFQKKWGLGIGARADVYAIIGVAAFLGLPCAYVLGDRFFRRSPQKPLLIAGISISVYGTLFVVSLYMPKLWMVVALQFLANASVSPIAICIFLTLAATAPPEMRSICFAMFGVYSLVFGGFAGSILLSAVSDVVGGVHGDIVALSLILPTCIIGGVLLAIGSLHVRRDITLVIEDVLERYEEGQRRSSGAPIPALQIHNLDFYYGANQVLFNINLEVEEGEIVALLGTNGAGKSTLLRAVAGLDHPHRGVIRLHGVAITYLEPEQIIDLGASLLIGGKMTVPGLTVQENLKIGEHLLRHDRSQARQAIHDAIAMFPELAARLNQPAGTLSGGEQQMLALARVLMVKPKLLMIDELALGLAPKTVDRLMEIVRRMNAEGTTVILVEQSVNRAMMLAIRAIFLERGEIRYDGPVAELLERDDLLRPVFLQSAIGESTA
ncbi:MAG: ATP-binding protein [Acidimicrobiales bacterium]